VTAATQAFPIPWEIFHWVRIAEGEELCSGFVQNGTANPVGLGVNLF
jgi:hypothetical protein